MAATSAAIAVSAAPCEIRDRPRAPGDLTAGAKLPPVRQLAADLASPSTRRRGQRVR